MTSAVRPDKDVSAAKRQRARRARVRDGLSVVTVTVPTEALGDLLFENGVLDEWDRDDRAALQRGLQTLIRKISLPDGTT